MCLEISTTLKLTQVTGVTLYLWSSGFTQGGLGETKYQNGGRSLAPVRRQQGCGLSGREFIWRAGAAGGRTETEKRISSGIGCASLQRGVTGREGGSDRGQIKLSGLARSTSGTDKMEFYNWHFTG